MPPCKSCGAPVAWVRVGDRPMPLDPDPDPGGNVVVDWASGRAFVLGRAARDAALAAEEPPDLYRSHFGTCPDADEWRRRR